jgi:hypothetical protein
MPLTSRPIVSSMIASAGYDPDTRVMEIEFRSGKTYTFSEVPPHVYENLLASDSPGRYFNQSIKNNY